jgi:hypothetical protein
VDGKTDQIVDYGHKAATIEDAKLTRACMVRITDRLLPEIHRRFSSKPL